MRKHMLAFTGAVTTVCLLMAIGGPVFAAKPDDATRKAAVEKAKQTRRIITSKYHGEVVSIDTGKRVISVSGKNVLVSGNKKSVKEVRNFSVPQTAEITKGNKVIPLNDLKAGDKIVVKYVGTVDSPDVKFILVAGSGK